MNALRDFLNRPTSSGVDLAALSFFIAGGYILLRLFA